MGDNVAQLDAVLGAPHFSSKRDGDDAWLARAAILLLAAPGFAVLCALVWSEIEADQGIHLTIALENDMAAMAAIAAIRAAHGDELLAAETGTTVSTVSGRRIDGYGINECA